MLKGHRGPCQALYCTGEIEWHPIPSPVHIYTSMMADRIVRGNVRGMGTVDEEISAMLQSSHASLSQASLVGVMPPPGISSTSPDLLTSYSGHCTPFHSHSRQSGPTRTTSMPHGGFLDHSSIPVHAYIRPPRATRVGPPPPLPQRWAPYNGEEKWVMDAKSEILETSVVHPNGPSFGAVYDNLVQPTVPHSLQRYHSVPSDFLQGLSELNEDVFSQGSAIPLINPSAIASSFSEGGHTPVTQPMDVDRKGSGSSMNDFEQFLSLDSDFSRRAAQSALQKPEANADAFGSLFPAPKSTLLRQKSSPAATLAQLNTSMQNRTEENVSEESMSGTSEDNHIADGIKAPLYTQDDFLRDTLNSWQSPTSPAGGKRQRGLPGESDTSSGSAEGSITFQNGARPGGGLIRHMSLPVTADGPMSPGDDDHHVQMRTRAKRGCATHPRSIAERVRRTRISERMKKLQNLVPNMDKQTNTSDMLDETVEYVKSLQMRVKELTITLAQLKAAQQTI